MSLRQLIFSPLILAALIYPTSSWYQLNRSHDLAISQYETSLKHIGKIIAQEIAANHQIVTSLSLSGEQANGPNLLVLPLSNKITLDGNDTDWPNKTKRHFGAQQLLETYSSEGNKIDAAFSLQVGRYQNDLYILLEADDEQVVYRELNNLSVHRNDHVEIAMVDDQGKFRRYTIASRQPGTVDAFVISSSGRALRRQPAIEGWLTAKTGGFILELKIPDELVSTHFAINFADVDDDQSRSISAIVGSASTQVETELGQLIDPSSALATLLKRYDIDQITLSNASDEQLQQYQNVPLDLTAAHFEITQPIIKANQTLATLTLRHNQADLTSQYQLQQWVLLGQSVLIILLSLVCGYLTYSMMSRRLTALKSQLEANIDHEGRVNETQTVSAKRKKSPDEIDQLSSHLAGIVERLRQYNHYLENMAGRLAHELRTPVSVVRSSLESIDKLEIPAAQQTYLDRAEDGVKRLTNILSKMSEASRLEQSLDEDEVEKFDLSQLVEGCISGHRLAYPNVNFVTLIETDDAPVTGIPELMAQLLDKLVANAVEFHNINTAITVRLSRQDNQFVLRVINEGPSLPLEMAAQLFDSMVSVRKKTTSENAHLGLGLYIVKVIAEFHGGQVSAHNRDDVSGVMIKVSLPILRLTSKLSALSGRKAVVR